MAKVQAITKIERVIRQVSMRQVLDRRLAIETLKKQLKDEEATLAALETAMLDDVDHGIPCEAGSLTVGINEVRSVRPKWKEEFAAQLGAEEVEAVLLRTEPTVTRKLTILKASGAGGK